MAATLRARGADVVVALGAREAFDVIVDGVMLYSKLEESRLISNEEILRRLDGQALAR